MRLGCWYQLFPNARLQYATVGSLIPTRLDTHLSLVGSGAVCLQQMSMRVGTRYVCAALRPVSHRVAHTASAFPTV